MFVGTKWRTTSSVAPVRPLWGRKNTTCDSAAKYPNPKIYTDFWDCNPKILYDFWD